jgi:hypothetical protein
MVLGALIETDPKGSTSSAKESQYGWSEASGFVMEGGASGAEACAYLGESSPSLYSLRGELY